MDWLEVVQELQRVTQAGLTYSENPFDRDRYEQLRGLAARIAASSLRTSVDEMLAILRAEAGYATPKVDVRAVVPKDGKLLFVREVSDGKWALPGGWADIGSTPAEMAAREVLEETGFVVKPTKLLGLLDKSKHAHPARSVVDVQGLMFRCEILGGEPRTSHETTAVGFFAENELPELSLPRNTEGQVRRMFELVRHGPELPTDFD